MLDNVLTGGLMRRSVNDARDLARQCLEEVGIASIAGKRARDLSFPERARVEAARALCTEPRILLLDEAMVAALNHVEMDEFLALLRRLRDKGLTLVVVEHHMRAIMFPCERIIVLNFGQVTQRGRRRMSRATRRSCAPILAAARREDSDMSEPLLAIDNPARATTPATSCMA